MISASASGSAASSSSRFICPGAMMFKPSAAFSTSSAEGCTLSGTRTV